MNFSLVGGVLLAVLLGGFGAGYKVTRAHYEHVALKALSAAKAETDALGENATLLRKARDAEKDRINSRLADALERVRSRPDRLPDVAAAACAGSSGRELSGPDAAFLERLAAEADQLRAAVAERDAWIENARKVKP